MPEERELQQVKETKQEEQKEAEEEKEEAEVGRYDRQKLVKGWDQEKLAKGVITIIGSDKLAKYIALPLTALGVGNIRIIDSAEGEDMLLDLPIKGYRVRGLGSALKRINPEVNVIGIYSDLSCRSAEYFLGNSDLIIDATNNMTSKAHALDFHLSSSIPLISAACSQEAGKVVLSKEKNEEKFSAILMPMFHEGKQGDLVSIELGGVVAEEAKKILMGYENLLNGIYNYNLKSSERFSFVSDLIFEERIFNDNKILIVGAGALGNFLGPASVTCLQPKRIDVMDFDKIEEHNLNRQVCFYDAVGKLKAERLAKTMKSISNGKTEINAITEAFKEDTKLDGYDLIFDAVDSFYTKAILHNYARKNNIPLISGGTDVRAATVLVYVPGKTSCLDCQINLSELAIKTEIIRRTSCIQAPDPSVIMTNQIAGALMLGEARTIFNEAYGKPINGEIKYISDFEARGGINRLEKICSCNQEKSLELPAPERVKVEEKTINEETVREVYVDGNKI